MKLVHLWTEITEIYSVLSIFSISAVSIACDIVAWLRITNAIVGSFVSFSFVLMELFLGSSIGFEPLLPLSSAGPTISLFVGLARKDANVCRMVVPISIGGGESCSVGE